MNRRKTLKNLLMASAGLVSLPAWANAWSPEKIRLPALFTPDEQEILAAVADTIIPAGDAIGALSVGTDKFLQKLLADCYEQEVQDNVRMQLNALNTTSEAIYGLPYSECDQVQRQAILLSRATSDVTAEKEFFELIKGETIRGFRTSREVLMKYYNYKVAPGHFYGCVDLNTTT